MIWTLNALQTGRADVAGRFLNGYPPEAATEGILGPHAIYPWELETLVNEYIAAPPNAFRSFNCRNWKAIGSLVNQLRAVENAEYGANREHLSILVELGRIGARQFPWQRGFANLPALYRSAFIYGQGECAAYLKETASLTVSDMTLVGFALLSVFHPEPAVRPGTDLDLIHEFGIERDALMRTLARIACPLSTARARVGELRSEDMSSAYKPSLLRQYPCFLVGPRERSMMAPLPDLIMDRVTNGLFYDVVGGGGPVRDEIGHRFEIYALDLLSQMLPDEHFAAESLYRTPHGQVATPDILLQSEAGEVRLAIECKAPRMSIAARFGETPDQDRGYEEIAKGVMQLWRFHAHCRQQTAPMRLAAETKLLILTLDEWFAGRAAIMPRIFERAHTLADASAHEIPADDRRPVAFCTVSELEEALATATVGSLLQTVEIASSERVGWIFSSLHQDLRVEKAELKDYPFQNALGDLLLWYARLQDLRDEGDEGDS